MNKSKLIILAWLLLLVPTLLLGVGALRLLQSEEARLAASSRAAAEDRAGAIAGNIDLAVAEVEDGLQETLRSLAQTGLDERLERWKRGNPLVRNVFVWQRGRGLILPDPQRPASDEEAAFIRRYLSLFTADGSWQEPPPESAPAPQPASSVLAERRELRQLAQQAPAAADTAGEAAPAAAQAPPGSSGWRSWYADDQLHLLGWFAPAGSELRYGVEVEMVALFSRLLGNLPSPPPAGEGYALLDGNGALLHQAAGFEISPGTPPLATVAVGSLPHFQVAAYRAPGADSAGGGVALFGSLLIGTFIAAILLGGSLLLWQAWRHQRDARLKTSFVSNVSHELKTPLTTIRMYAEMLGEGTITDEAKRRRYLETIVKESQRLSRLVGNVLDFSRLEQGRRSFHRDRLDLSALLGELLDRLAPRLAEAGMKLEREIGAEPLPVASDRDAIEQIVLNLLDNAVKYAADGGRLQVGLHREGGGLRLWVRDFGPGIPASHRQRIFDKFHRVDTALTARQQGAGLGLSIARQLAEGLGGQLRYTPAEGGGSRFELTLPQEKEGP